ncbi:MAG: hypothetical protein PHD40_02920 [Syntrophomonadaceae bacterium]|nr:hypothetical protein [Syntrophomonadaceae bacterium]
MNKGDFFTLYWEGIALTVCVVGFYQEEKTGEDIVVLALVQQENLVHIPLHELEEVPLNDKFIN